jgi:hypothetical protein
VKISSNTLHYINMFNLARVLVLALVASVNTAASQSTAVEVSPGGAPDQLAAVEALLGRVLGADGATRVEVTIVAQDLAELDGDMAYPHGYFTVGPSATPGKQVRLTGTTGIEVSSALNYYLNKYVPLCSISK